MITGHLVESKAWMKRHGKEAYQILEKMFTDCPQDHFFDHMLQFQFVGDVWKEGVLVGFSAVSWIDEPFLVEGVKCYVLINGPTVLVPAGWGMRIFFKQLSLFLAERVTKVEENAKVFMVMLSEGIKSFLFLENNFDCYYPHWAYPTPRFEQAVLNEVGAFFGKSEWVPEKGIVLYEEGEGKLKPEINEMVMGSLLPAEEKIFQFFKSKNPGFLDGDYLVCIAPCDRNYFAKHLCILEGEKKVPWFSRL
uniref:N-acetyltransferase domain-containing protein n=1 Tax=Paramoeba aestuarina TaxID=180227 RepID=A0A7S4P7X3_9EUKA|mmetsp:Transcript_37746/g.59636  ORF Transcript_37746/g.59636 Transcript_37746/m.59636 type:complete len:249 (+) Transcript_37746:74-820(+)|eukprot:CAMPEP_0201522762 /NCGR_PEP_ID=MMETSP0161_2-20130828/18537_1 /ASSEMBLY_ACC=CAM_ASM_000251 /TAXON_ID=180227 /ORGANISM="Neoparamoeba aestuarina, Strain SoJaBio B1-5/56/2" /LENGTH=248 /DNA_ID=CAMNT_0047921693 /DNA_START=48 /DNA_END=794 /DNA_ORIENTATION=+